MAKVNGTKLKILVGGTSISNLTNATLNINRAEIDVTTKDSSQWKEILPGLKDATISGEAILDFLGAAYNAGTTLFTDLVNGNLVALLFSDITTGDKSYSCSGYFTKCDVSGGVEDAAKLSFSIRITGAVTQIATT